MQNPTFAEIYKKGRFYRCLNRPATANETQMASNRTFTMIKPDAVANGHIGAILDKITKSGFKIVALKLTALTKEKAGFMLYIKSVVFIMTWLPLCHQALL